MVVMVVEKASQKGRERGEEPKISLYSQRTRTAVAAAAPTHSLCTVKPNDYPTSLPPSLPPSLLFLRAKRKEGEKKTQKRLDTSVRVFLTSLSSRAEQSRAEQGRECCTWVASGAVAYCLGRRYVSLSTISIGVSRPGVREIHTWVTMMPTIAAAAAALHTLKYQAALNKKRKIDVWIFFFFFFVFVFSFLIIGRCDSCFAFIHLFIYCVRTRTDCTDKWYHWEHCWYHRSFFFFFFCRLLPIPHPPSPSSRYT